MTEFPPLTALEEGTLDHLLGCPAENSVDSLYGWSTFGPCSLDEKTKSEKRARCERALEGLARKDYAYGGGEGPWEATDLAYWRHDWIEAVRLRGKNRQIAPDDLILYTFEQENARSYDKPSRVSVRALCRLDALDLAFYRMSRRGVYNDNFRSQLLTRHFDAKTDLSRDTARQDLAGLAR